MTLFSFRLTQQGQARDIALYRSSGSADLDNAALQCAAHFRESPATVGGKPAEITSVLGFMWRPYPKPSGFYHVTPDGKVNPNCEYPRIAVIEAYQGVNTALNGTTIVFYHLATDGAVKDASVVQTSGNSYFDKAAINCISAWKYFPAKANGQPVELDKIAAFKWRF